MYSVISCVACARVAHRIDGGGLAAEGVVFKLHRFAVGVGDSDHVAAQGVLGPGAIAGGIDDQGGVALHSQEPVIAIRAKKVQIKANQILNAASATAKNR